MYIVIFNLQTNSCSNVMPDRSLLSGYDYDDISVVVVVVQSLPDA